MLLAFSWYYLNQLELVRHAWLFSRRGIDVPTQRQIPPLLSCQQAELLFHLWER